MRVLISAYACEPDEGSEPGAGWTWARAAASVHDVTVLTRGNNVGPIMSRLSTEPGLNMHVVGVDLPPRVLRWKRGQRGIHLYYLLWQREARKVAKAMHAERSFDVVHHLTFANDWAPVGVRDLAPLVWGPVGGTTGTPVRLLAGLGARGAARELAREVLTRGARRIWGDRVARQAAVVVAQNSDTSRRFRRADPVVEPNVALDRAEFPAVSVERSAHRAVYAGRLIPLKGLRLALQALAQPSASQWRLDLYGDGPERPALEALAGELGITDRVRFLGARPRHEVLAAFARSSVMLFPSLHEGAGWVVAEALAMGCPVVCLDRGGPHDLLGADDGVAVAGTRELPPRLAASLDVAASMRPSGPDRFLVDRLPALLDRWYREAASSSEQRCSGSWAIPGADPQWLISHPDPDLVREALRLYKPSKRLATLATRLMPCVLGSRHGLRCLELANLVRLQEHAWSDPVPRALRLAVASEIAHDGWAASTGVRGPDRKTIVSLTCEGRSVAIAKVGTSPSALLRVTREARALERLAGSPIARYVPTLLGVDSDETAAVLLLATSPGRRPEPGAFSVDHGEFLRALATWEEPEPGAVVLPSLRRSAERMSGDGLVSQAIGVAIEVLSSVPCVGPSHGDFTPWNCLVGPSQFTVLDWEYFDRRVLGWDLAHYRVQEATHGYRTGATPAQILTELRKQIGDLVTPRLSSTVVDALIAVYLIDSLAESITGARVPAADGMAFRRRLLQEVLVDGDH